MGALRSTTCLIHLVVLGASDCSSWKSVTAIGLLQRRQEGSYVHTVHKTRYGRSRAGSTHARSPRTCSPRTRPARHLHRVGQRQRSTWSNQLAELGRVVAVAVLLERLEVLSVRPLDECIGAWMESAPLGVGPFWAVGFDPQTACVLKM